MKNKLKRYGGVCVALALVVVLTSCIYPTYQVGQKVSDPIPYQVSQMINVPSEGAFLWAQLPADWMDTAHEVSGTTDVDAWYCFGDPPEGRYRTVYSGVDIYGDPAFVQMNWASCSLAPTLAYYDIWSQTSTSLGWVNLGEVFPGEDITLRSRLNEDNHTEPFQGAGLLQIANYDNSLVYVPNIEIDPA